MTATGSGTVEHVVICSPEKAVSGERTSIDNDNFTLYHYTDSATLPLLLMGVNEETLRPSMKVLSGGTSIGHCVAALLSLLRSGEVVFVLLYRVICSFNFEVAEVDITSVQAATQDTNIVDGVTGEAQHYILSLLNHGRSAIMPMSRRW